MASGYRKIEFTVHIPYNDGAEYLEDDDLEEVHQLCCEAIRFVLGNDAHFDVTTLESSISND